MESIKMLWNRF